MQKRSGTGMVAPQLGTPPRFVLVVAQRFIDERAYGLCQKGYLSAQRLNCGVIRWRMQG
jgi:hypothetical protein